MNVFKDIKDKFEFKAKVLSLLTPFYTFTNCGRFVKHFLMSKFLRLD